MKIVFLLFFVTPYAFALTEREVVQSAIKNFPLVLEAQAKLKAAEGSITEAEGGFDTKLIFKSRNRIEDVYDNQYFETTLEKQTGAGGLGLVAGHRQGLGHFPAYDGKYKTSGGGEVFAGLNLPLLRNFQTDELRTNLAQKSLMKQQAENDLELKKMTYLHKALSAYYKWSIETKKLRALKANLALAQARQEMIQRKSQAGDIERIRVVDNQRSIDKRTSDVLKAQVDLERARYDLFNFVRDSSGQSLEIPAESSVELDAPKTEVSILMNSAHPQLEILKAEAKILELDQELARQSRLPGFNVELLGAKELSPNAAYDPESLQLGLKFDFPLENRKAEGKTVATTYKKLALEKLRQQIETDLHIRVKFAEQAQSLAAQSWQALSSEVEGAVRMASAEKTRWSQGAADLFTVNLREQDVVDAEMRRWSTLNDYLQARLDKELYSGNILQRVKSSID